MAFFSEPAGGWEEHVRLPLRRCADRLDEERIDSGARSHLDRTHQRLHACPVQPVPAITTLHKHRKLLQHSYHCRRTDAVALAIMLSCRRRCCDNFCDNLTQEAPTVRRSR